ncbi:hypothetical protein DPEC_G00153100 [Dallia pectoralis]|uniref:Uncharacterized protein n=1 Tax=Dallia pectoralis TaxID=75939 RepID=A0ACC2GK56_DALPE|nr:hypothetical protein DPEC_G00153100 [Dallia pectoralis]
MQKRHCPLLHPLNRQIPDRLLHPGVHLKLLEMFKRLKVGRRGSLFGVCWSHWLSSEARRCVNARYLLMES